MDIKSLVRVGKVSAVIPERCACRVVFNDRDNLVSAELPVLQSSCLNNKFYGLPDVGDSVVCLMIPNDPNGSGFVLGSFYHEKNPPPAQSQDISMIQFGDGSFISFDREKGDLIISVAGNIKINGKEIHLND